MRYFYDTEFIENGSTIDLISIGIVAEDGREFYAQNLECRFDRASEWVEQNVFPSLTNFNRGLLVPQVGDHAFIPGPVINAEVEGGYGDWYNRASIACHLRDVFVAESATLFAQVQVDASEKAEFWGYYADYDHVALCQLFGTMMNLPKRWPMYTRDIKQLCDDLGNPKLPEQGKGEHHALADARWNKQAYDFLISKAWRT